MVRISNVAFTGQRLSAQVSAEIRGEQRAMELWFDYPDTADFELRGEALVGGTLLIGMMSGQPIIVEDAPVSADFIAAAKRVQRVFRQWNPDLAIVDIKAEIAPQTRASTGIASSFSAGIDSFHSLIRNRDRITHLMTIGGHDRKGNDGTDFKLLLERIQPIAALAQKQLVAVNTNAFLVGFAFDVHWQYLQGATFCGIAHSLGFSEYIIPSSYTCRTAEPYGFHPILDPLWSTEATKVTHDSYTYYRTEKTEEISRHPEFLKHIQVCYHSPVSNCGKCSKCLRTAFTLDLLGVKDHCLPKADADAAIDGMTVTGDGYAQMVWEIAELAASRGKFAIEKRLRKKIKAYAIKRDLTRIARNMISPQVLEKFGVRDWRSETLQPSDPLIFRPARSAHKTAADAKA